MQKGKYGFSLWLYPFISLWLMLFDLTLANVLILGFVIVVEKDEWTIKQCAHVLMFSIYWGLYNFIMGMVTGWLASIPLVGGIAATPLRIIDTIVWIVLVILCFTRGLSRLKNGNDIELPGKTIVNRAFGFAQQQWGNPNQPFGQQQPYGQPIPQPTAYQQPYTGQSYAQPSYPEQPQYAPPHQPVSQDQYAAPIHPTSTNGQNPPPPPPPSVQ